VPCTLGAVGATAAARGELQRLGSFTDAPPVPAPVRAEDPAGPGPLP